MVDDSFFACFNFQVSGSLDIGIMRQFTFSSSVQCMSVIVRKLGSRHMDVFVKGAPEKIVSRCFPESCKYLNKLPMSVICGKVLKG